MAEAATNKWDMLSVLSPAKTGALKEQTSLFDDFSGTVIDIDHRVGESEEDGHFYGQAVFKVLIDNTDLEVEERWNMPTDDKTGQPARDADGELIRPGATSKWGRFEGLMATLEIPWAGDVSNLMGIHGHWLRKGTKRTRDDIAKEQADRKAMIEAGEKPPKRDRNEFPYGRYLVSWDYYNNEVRKSSGLAPITGTSSSGGHIEASTVTIEDPDGELVQLADGRKFLDLLAYIRENRKEMMGYAKREELERLVEAGRLTKESTKGGTVYHAVEEG